MWIVGILFFLVPYNLTMYGVNDVFDYESDLRNPRKAARTDGAREAHAPDHAVASALSCLPFVVFLVIVGSPLSWLVLALSLFFVVFYSAPPLRLKERPFADSVTSSIHFFSPAIYGLVLAGATWTWQLVAVLVAFALWASRLTPSAPCRTSKPTAPPTSRRSPPPAEPGGPCASRSSRTPSPAS